MKTKGKPNVQPLSLEMRLAAELIPWRCGHLGCSQWGSLFKQSNGSWSGRPAPGLKPEEQTRRCHYHGPHMEVAG